MVPAFNSHMASGNDRVWVRYGLAMAELSWSDFHGVSMPPGCPLPMGSQQVVIGASASMFHRSRTDR